jgi:hypothetical protein
VVAVPAHARLTGFTSNLGPTRVVLLPAIGSRAVPTILGRTHRGEPSASRCLRGAKSGRFQHLWPIGFVSLASTGFISPARETTKQRAVLNGLATTASTRGVLHDCALVAHGSTHTGTRRRPRVSGSDCPCEHLTPMHRTRLSAGGLRWNRCSAPFWGCSYVTRWVADHRSINQLRASSQQAGVEILVAARWLR